MASTSERAGKNTSACVLTGMSLELPMPCWHLKYLEMQVHSVLVQVLEALLFQKSFGNVGVGEG